MRQPHINKHLGDVGGALDVVFIKHLDGFALGDAFLPGSEGFHWAGIVQQPQEQRLIMLLACVEKHVQAIGVGSVIFGGVAGGGLDGAQWCIDFVGDTGYQLTQCCHFLRVHQLLLAFLQIIDGLYQLFIAEVQLLGAFVDLAFQQQIVFLQVMVGFLQINGHFRKLPRQYADLVIIVHLYLRRDGEIPFGKAMRHFSEPNNGG